jgi:hypothetical protein
MAAMDQAMRMVSRVTSNVQYLVENVYRVSRILMKGNSVQRATSCLASRSASCSKQENAPIAGHIPAEMIFENLKGASAHQEGHAAPFITCVAIVLGWMSWSAIVQQTTGPAQTHQAQMIHYVVLVTLES